MSTLLYLVRFPKLVYLKFSIVTAKLLGQNGIVRIKRLLLQATVQDDMNDLTFLLVFQLELQQLLESVQIVLGRHQDAEYLPARVRVHSLFTCEFQNFLGKALRICRMF